MTEKIVKASKKHKCDVCNKPILKGDFYIYGKDRIPKYEDDFQIGIKYVYWKICQECG